MTMDPINIIMLDETKDIFVPTGDHSIEQVLETICQKHGLNPYRYALSYDNYLLSNEFRLKTLNLQKDEELKLVNDFRPNSDISVTITLRVKDSHISANFHPNVTLWTVVENLVAAVTLKIPFSTPILIRKGVEYIGKEDLMKVTPRSLGFTSGFLFFRFLVIENAVLSKRTGGLLGSVESLQFELTRKSKTVGSIVHRGMSILTSLKTPEQVITFYPGIARRNSSVFGEINYLGERNALACRLPQQKLTARQKERRDTFYDMHVEDVKTMFKLVNDKRKELKERLINQQGRVEKMPATEKIFTVIRIQFPDKTVLQGFFNAEDKIKDVSDFIKLYRRVARKFQLIKGPPKVVLHSDETLAECGLVPTGKMFYKVVDTEPPMTSAYLKENVLRRLTTHEGACYAAALCHHINEKKRGPPKRVHYDENIRKSEGSVSESKPFILRPYESRTSYFRF